MIRRATTRIESNPIDAAIAVVVIGIGQLDVWLHPAVQPKLAGALTEFVIGAALAWRRRFPLGAFLCVVAADVAQPLAGIPLQAPAVPPVASVFAFYTLVTRASAPARVAAGAAAMLAGFVVMDASDSNGMGGLVFQTTLLAGTGIVGAIVRTRTARAGELETRAVELERERDAAASAAIEGERGRIARELHDIISHSLSVVVLQAGAADQVLDSDPDRARDVLQAIRTTGQEAIGEMTTLLALVNGAPDTSREPPPSLAEVEPLIAKTRAAGLPVELAIEGTVRALPAALELSAFRTVQEGLTNALKHAGVENGGAHVRVILRYGRDELEVEVDDDGRASRNGPGSRRGLAGLGERVAVFGGHLQAGPRPEGGWALRASFPLSP
jgi:signal transduction histidine kinase